MIGQFFGQEEIKRLVKASATTLSLPAGSKLLVGGRGLILKNPLSLNFATSGLGGLDTGAIAANTLYYVYAVISGTTFGLVASISSSGPSGFLAYKEIGKVISNDISELTDPVRYGDLFNQTIEVYGAYKGAVDNKILGFSTLKRNVGSGLIARLSTVNNGDTFTTQKCKVDLNLIYADSLTSSQEMGLSVNSTQLTTDINGISEANQLCFVRSHPVGNVGFPCSWDGDLDKNSIVRAHVNAAGIGSTPNDYRFIISATAQYEDII